MKKILNLLIWGPQQEALFAAIPQILLNTDKYHLERPVCLLFKNPAQMNRFRQQHLENLKSVHPLNWITKTYFQFYEDLLEQLNLPFQLMPSSAKLLLLAQIAGLGRKNWRYLADTQREPSLTALAEFSFLMDSLEQQYGEAWLESAGHSRKISDTTASFLADLRQLSVWYREQKNSGFIELHQMLSLVVRSLSPEGLVNAVSHARTVVWMDAADLNPLLFRLLEKLQESGLKTAGVMAYFPHPPVYEHKRDNFERLRSASENELSVDQTRIHPGRFFTGKTEPQRTTLPVRLFRFLDASREMEFVAAAVKKMIVEKNRAPEEIAVVLPNSRQYLNVVETVFSRHGIPYVNQIPTRLSASRVIQQLLLPVRLAESNYDVDVLKQILLSPYFNFKNELSAPLVNELIRQIRVQFGKADIEKQLQQLASGGLNAEEDDKTADPEKAVDYCGQVLHLAGFFEVDHSPREVLEFFKNLTRAHPFLRNESERQREEDFSALQMFFSLLEKWVQINNREEKLPPAAVFLVLRQILQSGSYRIRRPANSGVKILSPAQLADSPEKLVFLTGMDENAFRESGQPGQLIATAIPEEWRELIPAEGQSAEKERFLQLLNLPYEKLFISYPAYQGETPLLPSPFLRELQRVLEISPESPTESGLPTVAEVASAFIRAEGEPSVEKLPGWLIGMIDLPTFSRLQKQFKNLQTRYWPHFPAGIWEGDLTKNRLASRWMEELVSHSPFSVSRLEEYIDCPMKYFLHYQLGVSGEEETGLEISPLERGNFLHDVLFRFFRDIPEDERNYAKLVDLAKRMSSRLPLPEGVFKEAFLSELLGSEEKPGLLELFWEAEEEALQTDFRPAHFEFSFGLKGREEERDAASVEEPFRFERNGREYQLRGKIDRIDLAPDGRMVVMDYKTGSSPSAKLIQDGKKLQLPVYLVVASGFLRDNFPIPEPVAAAYYQLRDEVSRKWVMSNIEQFDPGKGNRGLKFPLEMAEGEPPRSLGDFLNITLERVANVIDRIATADFRHTTDTKTCGDKEHRCRFKTICRVMPGKQAANSENSREDDDSSPSFS